MTTSQFFVYKRPVAWTLLLATLGWGYFAYRAMPQRHDPIIPIRIATVVTIYPGADAAKVEREVTQKIEKQVALCDNVEKVRSLSRQNFSVVFVDLFDRVKNPEQVWQDLQGRLESMTDLPSIAGRPVRPQLNKDFGETIRADAHRLQPQGLRLRDPPAGGKHPRRGRRVPPRSPGTVSPRPAHGRPRLSQHRGTLLCHLAGKQPLAAPHRARPDRRRPNCGSPQCRLPRFSTGRRQVGRRVDPRGPAMGARYDRHGHVTPRHVARNCGPRPGHIGSQTRHEPSRFAGQARSLQLPGTSTLCRCDPRPAQAIPDDRQDR